MNRTVQSTLKSSATALFFVVVAVMLTSSQALAAVTASQATANAIGGNLLTTGTCSSTNDGSVAAPGTQTSSGGAGCTAGGPASNSGSLLSASVVVQTSSATPTSTSAACAGATGPGGGAIQVGPAGPCTGVSAGTSAGVVLVGSLVTAQAIFSTCTATPSGASGGSTLVSAGLGGAANILTLLGGLGLGAVTGAGTLPVNPGPNTTVDLALGTLHILTLVLNKQTTVAGTLTVTALDLTVLSGGLTAINNVPILGPALLALLGLGIANEGVHITVGTVTCGPNAAVVGTSALPGKAVPIAGGVLALAAGGAYLGRRKLFAAFRG